MMMVASSRSMSRTITLRCLAITSMAPLIGPGGRHGGQSCQLAGVFLGLGSALRPTPRPPRAPPRGGTGPRFSPPLSGVSRGGAPLPRLREDPGGVAAGEWNLNDHLVLWFRLLDGAGFARFLLHGFFRHCVPLSASDFGYKKGHFFFQRKCPDFLDGLTACPNGILFLSLL